ncbi:peptidoglycan DD-metalloendopeptidase family protein [Paenibacillus xerothermodurans]|uniref:peptidoglycan DD-metalloendopeptidase family protein n=1 Tax=Paenibacillus xerothermodurans TaxID=1977292 RepID=UPI003C73DDD8
MKWLQSQFTLVIIPGANSDVTRIKLSRGALAGLALGLLLVAGAGHWLYSMRLHSMASASVAESNLHIQTRQLQQDLASKNRTIDELQKKVFELSQQAAELRSKVEEIKQLEFDLRQLTATDESSGSGQSITLRTSRTTEKESATQHDTSGASFGSSIVDGAGGAGTVSAISSAEMKRAITSTLTAASPALTAGFNGSAHQVLVHHIGGLIHNTDACYVSLQEDMHALHARWTQAKQRLLNQREQALRIPSLWPTVSRTVTSNFGYRKDPITDKLSFHRGIDIAGKLNDPVYAAARGIAIIVGCDKFHGHHVVIEHGNGLRTWYMHLNRTVVHRGQQVERGQQVGKLGSSGRSTGPHLHYEVVRNGQSTDPKAYLPK